MARIPYSSGNGKSNEKLPRKAQDIEVLNQLIDDEDAVYRMRIADKVKYLHLPGTLFDDDTMCRPYLLIPALPVLPPGNWKKAWISRNSETEELAVTTSEDPLPAIEHVWHPEMVDVLSLHKMERHRSGVHQVTVQEKTAISKIACFDWDVQRIEQETWAYSKLEDYHRQNPQVPRFAPRFLGHLTEDGRAMGILIEKIEGRHAGIEDLEKCRQVVHRCHEAGLIHGDVNRYNFIVAEDGSRTILVDFEHAEEYDEETARVELEVLPLELTEETGRGGTRIMNEAA